MDPIVKGAASPQPDQPPQTSKRGSQHYKDMKIEPFEVFQSMGMLREYCMCAALKYIMRNQEGDLDKAEHCLEVALEELT